MKRRDALKAAAVVLVMLPVLLFARIATGKKRLLVISEQDAAVIALTGIVVLAAATPGAKQPQVNRSVDLLDHDGLASDRERFTEGLEWLDDYATKKNDYSFGKMISAEQIEILAEPGAAEGTLDFEKGLILVR